MDFMKSKLLLFCFISIVFSNEYLISVDGLSKENWERYKVIEVVDNTFIILATEDVMQKLSKQRIQFKELCKQPIRNTDEYFVVIPIFDTKYAIQKVSTIVGEYNNFYIVKVSEAQKDAFFDLKVERNLLEYEPYIFRTTVPPELQNFRIHNQDILKNIIKEVSKDSLRSYVKALASMDTRKASKNQKAVDWLVKKFKELGADSVFVQPVPSRKGNVIAIIKGKESSAKKYCLIGGHFDAVVGGPPAAGADDNASGTAAALEAIRVLKKFSFTHDIRAAAWDAEEVGLVGSKAHAQKAKKNSDQIIGGVVNNDMIGNGGNKANFIHYKTSVSGNEELAMAYDKIAKEFVPALNVKLLKNGALGSASDQASFWSSGYPSFLSIDCSSRSDINSTYHKPTDLLDGKDALDDSELMTNVTRTSIGLIAQFAKPLATPIKISNPYNKLKNGFAFNYSYSGAPCILFTVTGQKALISIRVFNLKGKQNTIFENRNFSSGSHALRLPVEYTSPGVYMVEFRMGSQVFLQKYSNVK